MPIPVFNYPSGQDSVIEVNSQDLRLCQLQHSDAYFEKFSVGHKIIKLNQSGPHYFISGDKSQKQLYQELEGVGECTG